MHHRSNQREGDCSCECTTLTSYKCFQIVSVITCKDTVKTLKNSSALQYSVGTDYDPEIQSSFTSSITPFLLTDSTSSTLTKLQGHIAVLETPKEMQGNIAIPLPNKPHTAFECELCKGTIHTILDGKMCCSKFRLFKALLHLECLQILPSPCITLHHKIC